MVWIAIDNHGKTLGGQFPAALAVVTLGQLKQHFSRPGGLHGAGLLADAGQKPAVGPIATVGLGQNSLQVAAQLGLAAHGLQIIVAGFLERSAGLSAGRKRDAAKKIALADSL